MLSSEFEICGKLGTVRCQSRVLFPQLPNDAGNGSLGHTKLVALFCLTPSGGSGSDDVLFQRRQKRQRTELVQYHPIPRDCVHLLCHASSCSWNEPPALSTASLPTFRSFTNHSGTLAPIFTAFSRIDPNSVRMYHARTSGRTIPGH